MQDDRHKRHEIRQSRHLHLVPNHRTVPAELDVEVLPIPNWMKPVPRTARHSSPLITYQRQHHELRRRCDRVPGLKYLARVLW